MDDVKISPLAKRLAEENSIDWRQIHGTGPEGRVIERDILTYLAKVMSGEAELPHQPDVSEPPPPAGAMPDFGQIPSMASATASMAKEGVDLSSMLADPVFGKKTEVQSDMNLDPFDASLDGGLDDAIFDLDLGDEDILEEPSLNLSAPTPSAPTVPSPSESADVLLEMDDDLARIPSPTPSSTSSFVPDLDLSHPLPSMASTSDAPDFSLEAFEVEPSSAPAFTPPTATEFAASTEEGFEFQMDDEPVAPNVQAEAAPNTDFSLSTPSEGAPSSLEPSFVPEPELPQPVFSTPDPVRIEPVIPAPIIPEPIVQPPAMTSTPLETGLAAAGAAALSSHFASTPTEPTPVTSRVSSSDVARDFFSVATLRRAFNARALLETSAQLSQALDGQSVPLAPFLARAAGRGHFGSSLALGSLDGDSLKAVAMPHLEGAFRDLITSISAAHLSSANADLTVFDASGLGADDVVLPVSGALLALGRANEGQATLTLSGKFDIAAGGAFLDRVAKMLENPVGLLV